ncbi:hypothetical protein AB0C14_01255 [Microbispora hainanensis]|uniref:hypothetical protein n=1 Tax=Microbispora hainanensis TaxID=568844 RepID=UPI0033D1F930
MPLEVLEVPVTVPVPLRRLVSEITSVRACAAIEGFYDQSHMTAEFRALMGVPPAAFFAGRLPSLEPC